MFTPIASAVSGLSPTGAQVKTRAGAMDPEPRQQHQKIGGIDKQVLAEEDGPDDGDFGQSGQQDGNRGNRQGHPDEVLAQVTAQPRPPKGKRQAADDLVDAQGDRHEGVDGGKRTPCEHGRGDPCCGAFCRDDREESADGSREHHPLDAKVQHSRSFAEDLSQGG